MNYRGIIGNVKWISTKVLFGERVFLFCFDEKCMSGKISNIKEISPDNYEIKVVFIEPDFFSEQFIVNNNFTIREASTVLGEGIVNEIF